MSQPTDQPTGSRRGGGDDVAQGYAEALAELETILAELERTDVDVDVLAAQVKRAAERIGNARMQIEQVVADLGTDE